MTRWLLNRVLMIIPVLLIISILAFLLMRSMQSEINLLKADQLGRNGNIAKTRVADDNLPLFYFSILPSNYPDTIYKIRPKSTNQRAISFLRQGTKWEDLQKYLLLEKNLSRSENQSLQSLIWLINQSNDLHEIKSATQHVSDSLRNYPDFQSWVGQLDRCIAGSNKLQLYFPSIYWYGMENQYHRWISRILHGNLGNSIVDNRPAWTKIKEALSWTLSFNLISLLLIFLLAILAGEYLYKNVNNKKGRFLEALLLFFYSIPRFFFGIILIYLFASDTIFPALHIFPTPGFMNAPPEASIFQKWAGFGIYLVLPTIAMVIPSLAYISRLYLSRLLEEGTKPYAFWAWSRGVPPEHIIKKHLRKNAFMPILALIGMELPLLLGGSVVIEVLFNIPGMGRLMMQSILLQDWIVVFSILFLTGVLTVLGKLVTDIMIGSADKRIKWA
ncbi:MAG: ABC transporter permease [Saprospiraceae bacterium]|nr:ABC transporter permease [Saprospiraceae bacterium]MBP7922166.1 ABC transporter permease [Saprospiraceae bacterium]